MVTPKVAHFMIIIWGLSNVPPRGLKKGVATLLGLVNILQPPIKKNVRTTKREKHTLAFVFMLHLYFLFTIASL